MGRVVFTARLDYTRADYQPKTLPCAHKISFVFVINIITYRMAKGVTHKKEKKKPKKEKAGGK